MTRKRLITIVLLPILAPLFLIGWELAQIGDQKLAVRKTRGLKEFVARQRFQLE